MARLLRRVATLLLASIVALAGAFAAGVLWPLAEPPAVRPAGPLAFTGVTVVDVAGARLLANQTVLVAAGRIAAAGPAGSVTAPPGATMVDGRGRFLMPALWDMHAHVYAFAPMLDLPLYIAYGVTAVRDMQGCPHAGDPFIACAADKRRWSDEALAGLRVGPRIVSSTSFMANGPGMQRRLGDVPAYYDTATPDQARAFVRHFAGQVEEIKVYDRIPRAAYFALADEAHRLGLRLVGHRPHAVSAVEAARRQRSLEHARFVLHESFSGAAALRAAAGTPQWREDRRRMLDEHDPALAQAIFGAMKQAGTYYVPTHLTRWVDAYADDPVVRDDELLRYVHPLLKRQWLEDVEETLARDPSPAAREDYRAFYRKGLALTGAAHRAGVRVLAGTDYIVAGADLHRELQQLVRAGLAPADALRAATLSAAEYYGLQHHHGSVETGKSADLLLLAANPLQDIANTTRIEAVVFNGALYDRPALDDLQRHVERQARSAAVGCKILWRFIRNPVAY